MCPPFVVRNLLMQRNIQPCNFPPVFLSPWRAQLCAFFLNVHALPFPEFPFTVDDGDLPSSLYTFFFLLLGSFAHARETWRQKINDYWSKAFPTLYLYGRDFVFSYEPFYCFYVLGRKLPSFNSGCCITYKDNRVATHQEDLRSPLIGSSDRIFGNPFLTFRKGKKETC